MSKVLFWDALKIYDKFNEHWRNKIVIQSKFVSKSFDGAKIRMLFFVDFSDPRLLLDQDYMNQSSREFILFFPWIPNMSKSVLLSQGALALMSKLPHLIYQKIFRLGILIQREPLKRTEEWRRRQCANHSSFTRGGSSFWTNSWCRTTKVVKKFLDNYNIISSNLEYKITSKIDFASLI